MMLNFKIIFLNVSGLGHFFLILITISGGYINIRAGSLFVRVFLKHAKYTGFCVV